MVLNAFFFVDALRSRGSVTLIDSLQDSFGQVWGGIVYLPACLGDICWEEEEEDIEGGKGVAWAFLTG